MPRNGGVSFIRTWSPSPETGDGRGIPVSVSEADSLVSFLGRRWRSRRAASGYRATAVVAAHCRWGRAIWHRSFCQAVHCVASPGRLLFVRFSSTEHAVADLRQIWSR